MDQYNGAYKVVNRDWCQSLPEIFDTFEKAFQSQQNWDKDATIEQINGESVDVVWQRDYNDFVSNVHF